MMQHVVRGGYPPEVEDLLLDTTTDPSPTAACSAVCAAGYAVITYGITAPALVFRVASPDTSTTPTATISLDVPRSSRRGGDNAYGIRGNRGMLLAAWPVEWKPGYEGRSLTRMGVAVCSREGYLRIYRNVDVEKIGKEEEDAESSTAELACEELRLLDALRISCGKAENDEIVCLGINFVQDTGVTGEYGALVVVGGADSAARVSLSLDMDQGALVEAMMNHNTEPGGRALRSRASMGLSSLFYSALRSLGADSRASSTELVYGLGKHRFVGGGPGPGGAYFAVYRGGKVLKWKRGGLLWSWNVFDSLQRAGSDAEWALLSAAVASTGTVVILGAKQGSEPSDSHELHLMGLKETDVNSPPDDIAMSIDLDLNVRELDSVQFVVSGDLAYIVCPEDERIVWSSVTPGVSSTEQVRGRADISDSGSFFQAVDLAFSLTDSLATGGAVAFLSADSALLVRSGVPAPILTTTSYEEMKESATSKAKALVQCAYLQYAAGQCGAAKATLSGLVSEAFNGKDKERSAALEALGEAVSLASRNIIDDSSEHSDAAVLLLIDTRLESKAARHEPLMKFLADQSFLNDVIAREREEVSRLWDLLSDHARSSIISDAEKLAAAASLRKVENIYSDRGKMSRFLEDDVSAAPSIRARSQLSGVDDEDAESGPSIITEALRVTAERAGLSGDQPDYTDQAAALYEKVSLYDRVLPAIGDRLRDSLDDLKDSRNDGESEEKTCFSLSSLRRFAREKVLLADEAALAIVLGAAECRESISESLHISRSNSEVSWSCARKSCRIILANMIDVTLEAGKSCRAKEAYALQNAACHLADALLMCGQNALLPKDEEHDLLQMSSVKRAESPKKRRRVGCLDPDSLWAQERHEVLDRLINNVPTDSCLELATKYKDFGVMLQLKHTALDFDEYFEKWYSSLGRDFGIYACKWLEGRGELKLLLRGREDNMGPSVRSESTRKLVEEYFQQHRSQYTNISWMHYLAQNNFEAAAADLQRQALGLSQPGKPGALSNTKLLYSIAKLAVHASKSKAKEEQAKHLADTLFLLRANEQMNDGESELMEPSEVIKRIVDEAPIETKSFADKALRALQCIELKLSTKEKKYEQLRDYIWRRIVEREGHIWIPLTTRASSMGDTKLRVKLGNTAFCRVVRSSGLSSQELKAMIQQGIFDLGDAIDENQRVKLHSLLQTTMLVAPT